MSPKVSKPTLRASSTSLLTPTSLPSNCCISPCGKYIASIVVPRCVIWRINTPTHQFAVSVAGNDHPAVELHSEKIGETLLESKTDGQGKLFLSESDSIKRGKTAASCFLEWQTQFLEGAPNCLHFVGSKVSLSGKSAPVALLIGRTDGIVTAYDFASKKISFNSNIGAQYANFSQSLESKLTMVSDFVLSGSHSLENGNPRVKGSPVSLPEESGRSVLSMTCSFSRSTFFTCSRSHIIHSLSIQDGHYLSSFYAPHLIECLSITPCERFLLLGGSSSIFGWDLVTNLVMFELTGVFDNPVFSIHSIFASDLGISLESEEKQDLDKVLPNNATANAFSDDPLSIVAVSGTQNVYVWILNPEVRNEEAEESINSIFATQIIRPTCLLSCQHSLFQVSWVPLPQKIQAENTQNVVCIAALTDSHTFLLWKHVFSSSKTTQTKALSSASPPVYEIISYKTFEHTQSLSQDEIAWNAVWAFGTFKKRRKNKPDFVANFSSKQNEMLDFLLVRGTNSLPDFETLSCPASLLLNLEKIISVNNFPVTLILPASTGKKKNVEVAATKNDTNTASPFPSKITSANKKTPTTFSESLSLLNAPQTRVSIMPACSDFSELRTPPRIISKRLLSALEPPVAESTNVQLKEDAKRSKVENLQQESQAHSIPASASMATVLHQALQTADTTLLDSTLSQRDPVVIRHTIEELSLMDSFRLLEFITEQMQNKALRVHFLGNWLLELVKRRAAFFMGHPAARPTLDALYHHIARRLHMNHAFLRLQGRVDTLVMQATARKGPSSMSSGNFEEAERKPLIEYTEK